MISGGLHQGPGCQPNPSAPAGVGGSFPNCPLNGHCSDICGRELRKTISKSPKQLMFSTEHQPIVAGWQGGGCTEGGWWLLGEAALQQCCHSTELGAGGSLGPPHSHSDPPQLTSPACTVLGMAGHLQVLLSLTLGLAGRHLGWKDSAGTTALPTERCWAAPLLLTARGMAALLCEAFLPAWGREIPSLLWTRGVEGNGLLRMAPVPAWHPKKTNSHNSSWRETKSLQITYPSILGLFFQGNPQQQAPRISQRGMC